MGNFGLGRAVLIRVEALVGGRARRRPMLRRVSALGAWGTGLAVLVDAVRCRLLRVVAGFLPLVWPLRLCGGSFVAVFWLVFAGGRLVGLGGGVASPGVLESPQRQKATKSQSCSRSLRRRSAFVGLDGWSLMKNPVERALLAPIEGVVFPILRWGDADVRACG